MILSFLLFLCLFYLFYCLLIWISLSKLCQNVLPAADLPISIVVAAKNEERNIPELLRAVECQNYPKDMFEIIIVDDHSSDNTRRISENYCSVQSNLRVLTSENKSLPGKKGALDVGIKHARHQYILITDADCIPQREWLSAFAKEFNNGFQVLFGIAPFYQRRNFITGISCFENLRSSILTFSAAGLKLPYSAAARSFGFTKSAFESVNGYNGTLQTMSGDDDLFIREAAKKKLKIGTVTAEDSKVYSEAKKTLKSYIAQKARHTSTANYYLFQHQVLLGSWHLVNLVLLFSVCFSFLSPLFAAPFIMKLAADFFMVKRIERRFGYKFNSVELLLLQIVYELLIVVSYFSSFFRRNKW